MKIRRTQIAIVVLVGLLLIGMAVLPGCKKSEPAPAPEPGEGTAVAATVQTTCPVMAGAINKDLFIEYKGKKVYFCCAGCVDTFKANPEKYLDKLPQFKE